MPTHDEQQIIIHHYPIYRGLTILMGVVIAAGMIIGMGLSNSAATLLAGSSFGSFLGTRVNEKISLCMLFATLGLSVAIFFARSWYCAVKTREAAPVR
ncbi:MAG: hypothetical protein P4L36_11710 [Holophaga sp.]|nr:hypothetical protein [Holophaga sp.]